MPKKPKEPTHIEAQSCSKVATQHGPTRPAGVILNAAHLVSVKLDALLLPEHVAALTGFSTQTLANDRATGKIGLPFVKIGGSVRYRAADLATFIEARVVRPGQPGTAR